MSFWTTSLKECNGILPSNLIFNVSVWLGNAESVGLSGLLSHLGVIVVRYSTKQSLCQQFSDVTSDRTSRDQRVTPFPILGYSRRRHTSRGSSVSWSLDDANWQFSRQAQKHFLQVPMPVGTIRPRNQTKRVRRWSNRRAATKRQRAQRCM